MSIVLRRRNVTRILVVVCVAFVIRYIFTPSSSAANSGEIRKHGVLDLVSRSDRVLDVQRHDFLQVRMGRDERGDIFQKYMHDGVDDFWERFEKPYIMGKETAHIDQQNILSSIEQLLSLNGWVAALCPTLTRPFGQNKHEDMYDDLLTPATPQLYYVAIVIHSADHFLVDQLAVIVQLARRLGSHNIFVSMLDYSSTDSTETLTDLCEAVLILLGVPFRIRRIPGMTADPTAAYYPLEEAYARNMALEPLHELWEKRKIKFYRVIWLKGFTCPNDILEVIKVSKVNDAAMVCGMDWAENYGFFIFSDRWRTRDIHGDQFRQTTSTSTEAIPPRDKEGAARYKQHLPFQVFCCESGTHVVDPEQSYYQGIAYRAGTEYHNLSTVTDTNGDVDVGAGQAQMGTSQKRPTSDSPCLDSAQSHFCRDLWVSAAREGVEETETEKKLDYEKDAGGGSGVVFKKYMKRDPGPDPQAADADTVDADANVGSDYDAMPDSESDLSSDSNESGTENPYDDIELLKQQLTIPNVAFRPARILINPRCVTTYAGISHTQLAAYLFGPEKDDDNEDSSLVRAKYVLDDWEGAPESFVCQEQRQTGGRQATKTQRRLAFSIHEELERLRVR